MHELKMKFTIGRILDACELLGCFLPGPYNFNWLLFEIQCPKFKIIISIYLKIRVTVIENHTSKDTNLIAVPPVLYAEAHATGHQTRNALVTGMVLNYTKPFY